MSTGGLRRAAVAMIALVGTLVGAAPAAALAADPALPAPVPARGPVHAAGPATATGLATATDFSEGLRVEASTTFAVDLAASVVHVGYDATVTNTTTSSRSGSWVRSYYFTDVPVEVVPGASGVHAEADGVPLDVSVQPSDQTLWLADVRLPSTLEQGENQTIHLGYDVGTQPARSGAAAQVNHAYATFPVFVTADPGLGSVSVRLPQELNHDVVGEPLSCATVAGATVCDATAIADPAAWISQVAVRDDAAMVSTAVTVGDKEVDVLAWPGDEEWGHFVADTVQRGLPVLERLFGQSWGVRPRLEVIETSAPYLYGYAGWYVPSTGRIELGDELDAVVTLHELSHAWLNSETFTDRWINEGLAQEYATLALREMGEDAPAPEAVDQTSSVAVPLGTWEAPAQDDPDAHAKEHYGYNTSWWLTDALAQEIGADKLAEVVKAGGSSISPYPAPTVDTRLSATPDWRSYLDLLESVGGSTKAADLFRSLAVAPADQALLDRRATARAAYAALVAGADADGWAPPAVVRAAMAEWRFDDAEAMFPRVEQIFAQRARIARALASVGVDLPVALEKQTESGADLEKVAARMSQAGAAVDAYIAAASKVDHAGPVLRLGLLVDDSARADVARAGESVHAGDWDAVRDAAAAVDGDLGGAGWVGWGALATLAAVLAAGALVTVRAVRGRRGRTAGPVADARADGEPSVEESVEAGVAEDAPVIADPAQPEPISAGRTEVAAEPEP